MSLPTYDPTENDGLFKKYYYIYVIYWRKQLTSLRYLLKITEKDTTLTFQKCSLARAISKYTP